MKTSAFIAILLAATTALSAMTVSPCEKARCRELASLSLEMPVKELIAIDLVNGVWIFENSQTKQEYQFDDDGRAGILSKDKEGYLSYESFQWRVEVVHDVPFLAMEGAGEVAYLQVEQTCEGLNLVNPLDNNAITLLHSAKAKNSNAMAVKARLVGDWTNVTMFDSEQKCENAKGAFFNYEFKMDGTYACSYGSQSQVAEERGIFEVSSDGQFLLLKVEKSDMSTCVGGTKVIRINQVDDHGLILEQAMRTNDVSEFFCTDVKSFAFIK